MPNLTPREIVAELDRHIVGQHDAKRAVAIAVRNRWRWQQLPDEVRREITPKNILMIGPTGVGKTEITRRLATLTGAPFVKTEATKYSEVGYVGRDVEGMVRDLVEAAISMVKVTKRQQIEGQAAERVESRLLDLLVAAPERSPETDEVSETPDPIAERHERTRQKFRDMLRAGELEDRRVTLRMEQRQGPVQVFSNMGMEQMDIDFQNMFERLMPKQRKEREITIKEARAHLMEAEIEGLMDKEAIHEEAVALAERSGIIFIDEIDKICGGDGPGHGADVSRQGVQRDLLPIVEGTSVQTRYGQVSTEHVLFIAAGAFHRAKPSDLMPELQGRFPIRVELTSLNRDDFVRILTEPTSSVTRQCQALLGTEGITLEFTENGIGAIADAAHHVNQTTQNIGARRLYTIVERLLDEISFDGPDRKEKHLRIDADYVSEKLAAIVQDEDLSRFIL